MQVRISLFEPKQKQAFWQTVLNCVFFQPFFQRVIHSSLPVLTCGAKLCQHFGIKLNGYLFFGGRLLILCFLRTASVCSSVAEWLTNALAQSDSVVAGLSSSWMMSLSVRAFTFSQSVKLIGVLPVDAFFMFLCLANRNNRVVFTTRCMHHEDDYAVPKSKCL